MSEENQESGEKIHDPTPKKLADARKKGNIARSQDILVAVSYLGLWLALLALGPALVGDFGDALALIFDDATAASGFDTAGHSVTGALRTAAIVTLVPLVLAAIALIAQRGIVFTPANLAPKLSRIDPIKGLGKKFGPAGLFEFAKSMTKLVILSAALALWLWARRDIIVGLSSAGPGALATVMGQDVIALVGLATLVAGGIAGADWLWQTKEHRRKLRMSHQDLKDETKDSDGDPHQRAQRRKRAQDIASNRMMQDVPSADVVIVNPTEIAICLKWTRTAPGAPVCVAKGEGEIARRIRERAGLHGVPIHRDVPTARTLYQLVDIGAEVPEETYRAVAAAIRFADAMRMKARSRA